MRSFHMPAGIGDRSSKVSADIVTFEIKHFLGPVVLAKLANFHSAQAPIHRHRDGTLWLAPRHYFMRKPLQRLSLFTTGQLGRPTR
jgi:hypothetical protein